MRFVFAVAALVGAVFAAPGSERRDSCNHDNCLRAFLRYAADAQSYCSTYAPGAELPDFATSACQGSSIRVQSACSCVYTAPATTSSSSSSATSASTSTTSTSTSTTSSISTSSTVTSSATSSTSTSSTISVPITTTSTSTTATSTSSSTTSSDISTTSSTTTSSPTESSTTSGSSPSSTSTSSMTSISTTSTSASSTITAAACTATVYAQIAPAVAACTAITLQDIFAPTNSSIDLSKLKPGTVVTFAGTTTFDFTNSSTFNPIVIGGKGITITSAPGAIIDGNGQAYWDGMGSNGGVPKPDHFIVISKVTMGSVIENLHIQNWPTHLFSISSCSDLTFQNLYLDNSAGNAPNDRSNGLPAAHNSDGFDLSSCNNTLVTDSTVINQDDCVAITSGNNITVNNMYCSGGHGLSIGSVGGKSNNRVTNIVFQNSVVTNSQNGARIKSNYNTTGFISNITYSNIALSGITIYGIDVQQDYLNGGPTGSPSNGVIIQNLLFNNVTGTASPSATDYYILCGDGSCSNFNFVDVSITGGTTASTCNYPPSGCPP